MTTHHPSPAEDGDAPIHGKYEAAKQILDVRQMLVSTVFRSIRIPMDNCWSPDLDRAWRQLCAPALARCPDRLAEEEWRMRAALFGLLSRSMAVPLLLQGNDQLVMLCGQQPAMLMHEQRMTTMGALMNAIKTGSVHAASAAALTQVELDQYELKSFFDQPMQ